MPTKITEVEVQADQSEDGKPYPLIYIWRDNGKFHYYQKSSLKPIHVHALRLVRGIHLLTALSKRLFEQEMKHA